MTPCLVDPGPGDTLRAAWAYALTPLGTEVRVRNVEQSRKNGGVALLKEPQSSCSCLQERYRQVMLALV